jgi:hypothetical protein
MLDPSAPLPSGDPAVPKSPAAPATGSRRRRILGLGLALGCVLAVGLLGWQLANGEASPQAPPRISLAAFKALYDDPAQQPLILDVRGLDQYAAGHITGAHSFPESEAPLRVVELPHDRLIVVYCA